MRGQSIKVQYAFNPNMETALGQMHTFGLEYSLGPLGEVKGGSHIQPESEHPVASPGGNQEIILTIMEFKNAGKIEKLAPLSKGLPNKTLQLLKDESLFQLKSLESFRGKTDAKTLLSAGVTFAVEGSFDRNGNNLSVQYFLWDLRTKERFGEGAFETEIKPGVADDMAVELANRIRLSVRDHLLPTVEGGLSLPTSSSQTHVQKKETQVQKNNEKPIVTIMNLKNTTKNEKLEALSAGLPERVIKLMEGNPLFQVKGISSFGTEVDLSALEASHVQYVVAGAFEMQDNKIMIQYLFVDVKTKERFGKDSFSIEVKKGIADALAAEFAQRIETGLKRRVSGK
jgi:TolB-like protein